MVQIINWLSERKLLNGGLVVAYVIAILCLHDMFVNLSVWIMQQLTLDYYDKVILGIVGLSLVFLAYFFYKNLQRFPHHQPLKIFLLATTLVFFVLHLKILLVVNIELIHAVQYGILALLIFPISRRFGYALLFATLVGYLDEWYQYQLLYPERENYFDFNDIITDQLGMGLFLLILYTAGVQTAKTPRPKKWWQSTMLVFVTLLFVIVAALVQQGIIVTYASAAQANTWLILNEAAKPEDFWVEFLNSGRFYHILTPLQGILIHLFLIAFYSLMDVFSTLD